MIKKYLFLFFAFLVIINSYAQEEIIQDTSSYIKQDPRVDSLIKLHRKALMAYLQKDDHNGIDGFRILIFRDVGNNATDKITLRKNQFDASYPNVPSYLTYDEPWFRVVVGDFRTKLEAEEFLRKLKRRYRYRGAFVVASKIKLPPLVY